MADGRYLKNLLKFLNAIFMQPRKLLKQNLAGVWTGKYRHLKLYLILSNKIANVNGKNWLVYKQV